MVFLERLSTQLSAAIIVKEATVPEGQAIGELWLKSPIKYPPIRHSIGYFLLLNIPAEGVSFSIGGYYYQAAEFHISASDLVAAPVFKECVLQPAGNYPYSVLKGKVCSSSDGHPVSGVTVEAVDLSSTITSQTDGSFIFRFANQMQQVKISFTKSGFQTQEVTYWLQKGSLKTVDFKLNTA